MQLLTTKNQLPLYVYSAKYGYPFKYVEPRAHIRQ